MAERDHDVGRDERGFGERPGVNQNPLSPSFRDGPRTTPASTRSLLLGLVPVVVIGLVLAFVFLR